MEEKMDKGRAKGKFNWDNYWKDDTIKEALRYLFDRLDQEIHELEDSVYAGDGSPKLEAADVANLALMIADVTEGFE